MHNLPAMLNSVNRYKQLASVPSCYLEATLQQKLRFFHFNNYSSAVLMVKQEEVLLVAEINSVCLVYLIIIVNIIP